MKSLRRPMFRTGGPIGEGLMHGMNGLQNGGTVRHMNGFANGGRAALVGNPIFPRGPDGRAMHANFYTTPEYTGTFDNRVNRRSVNLGGGNTRLSSGVTNTNVAQNLSKMQKAKNMLQKSKSLLKNPMVSEKGIQYLLGKKIPQYAKGAARWLGTTGGGFGSRFPVTKKLAPYYAMWKASEVTPVDEKYNISRYRDNLFAPLQTGDTSRDIMQKKALRNAEQAANPNNFWRYDSGKYGPRKDHPNYDPEKIRYNPFSKDTGAADTEIPRDADGNIIRYNDAESMFGLKKLKATPGYGPKDKEDLPDVPEPTGGPKKSQAEIDAAKKIKDEAQLDKIYKLLGVDRAKKNAASKALADMSRYIDEGGKDTISRKNIGSTLTKGILAFDKRLDKVDQLKEASGLMLAKAEIENMMDPYGKELKRTGVEINKAKIAQANDANTIMASFRSTAGGGLTAEQAAKTTANKLYKDDYQGNIIDSDTFEDLIKENSETGRGEREVIIKVIEGIADKYNKPNGVYTVKDKIIEIENKKVKNIIVG